MVIASVLFYNYISLPRQRVPLPLLVSLVSLETRLQGGLELSLVHVMQAFVLA